MKDSNEQNQTQLASIWTKVSNPLRFLNTFEIERLLDMARLGGDVRLQAIYALIEQQNPLFSICIEKRCSGLAQRNWDIVPLDDTSEAKSQASMMRDIFNRSDELSENNLTDAFRKLQSGAFRGRAYVKPFFDPSTKVLRWKPVENWNILRAYGRNWWNPDANEPLAYGSQDDWTRGMGLVEIPDSEVCYTTYPNPVDLPGVTVYLRQMVGETKWAQIVERRGNPQVVLTAPDGTPDSALGLWNQRAIQIQNGASGVLPPGAKVDQLVDARTDEPFAEFVKHQEEVICIMAIGGTLNTLGGHTGLGSNLADKQDEQFQALVSLDGKKIQNTVNGVAIEKVCRKLGQKRMCKFQFTEQDSTTPSEYLEMAVKAKSLGAGIDLGELKQLTKLSFISLPGNPNGQEEVWQPTENNEG